MDVTRKKRPPYTFLRRLWKRILAMTPRIRRNVRARESTDKAFLGDCGPSGVHSSFELFSQGSLSDRQVEHCGFNPRDFIVGKKLAADTHDFLMDRLESLAFEQRIEDDQIVKWGLDAIAFYDEVALLRNHIPAEDWIVVTGVLDGLQTKMRELGLCIINEDEWDPQCQRAVSVIRKKNVIEVKLVRKIASGLRFKNNIVKKQEVAVEMPIQN